MDIYGFAMTDSGYNFGTIDPGGRRGAADSVLERVGAERANFLGCSPDQVRREDLYSDITGRSEDDL